MAAAQKKWGRSMRYSLQRRFVFAIGISIAAGLLGSGYILQKFRGYEDSVSRMMSGDTRAVLQGHLLEARIKAAIELAQASVNSEQANEAFREKITKISDDVKALSKENPDKSLDDAKKVLNNLISSKSEALEDLFVHYRNLKTSAFNLYRVAWSNKWMTVAHNVGLIINDLDNLPYHSGEKAASSILAKIGPLVGVITKATLAQDSKMYLMGQLNGLKTQVTQYTEAVQRSEKIKVARTDELHGLANIMKKYNESQGKQLMQFGNEARTEVFKGVMAFLCLILFSLGWYMFASSRFLKAVMGIANHISRQMNGWVSSAGAITAQGFTVPEKADAEFSETYAVLDQVIRRMNAIRKEDVLVKRLLHVPILLVNRNKQAIFWNSALSILGRVRALEETGAVPYANLVRFTSGQGKAIDPVDKAFSDNKEVSQLALMRIGDDGLAVQVNCTPVQGPDHQAEYVMVHIRDLREENRRAEAELDRQLETIRMAVQQLRQGKIPVDSAQGMRKPVIDCVQMLKNFALELQEKSAVIAGHIETMKNRMGREANLKKNVHGRLEQVKGEIGAVRSQLAELSDWSNALGSRADTVGSRAKVLRSEYEHILKRGNQLLRDLKSGQELVSKCIARLNESEEVSGRVRANERMIRGLLEKSSVLNANNSILGSKRELTPADVVSITENITQLMGQFERSYRFIEQSVGDVERGLQDLAVRLRESLASVSKLTENDHDLVRAVKQSERVIEAGMEDAAEFIRELSSFQTAATRVSAQITSLENKIQALTQIGQASLELQTQLESGFAGMFEQVGGAPNHGNVRSTGGTA